MDLVFRAIIVSFAPTTAVTWSMCIGIGVWVQRISIKVWRIGTSYFAVMNIDTSSVSAADYMKNFITWEIVNMGSLYSGNG